MTRSRGAALLTVAALAGWVASCAKSGAIAAGVGEGCAAAIDCASPLVCSAGKCALPVGISACVADSRRCEGADLLACDVLGLHETVVQTCPFGCSAGQCVEAACTAGARRCGTAGLEVCTAGPQGAPAWVLAETCPAGCDPATTACKPLACRPLEVRCSPSAPAVVQTCAPDGTAFVDSPCATGARCVDGACVAQACAPGSSFCDGATAKHCNATGTGVDGQTACALGCSGGVCASAVCSPGAQGCVGSALVQCKPDGSGTAVVQQCGAGGCVEASAGHAGCAAAVCPPLARRCAASGASVEVCLADGSAWSPGVACDNGCLEGACLPPPAGCTAGQLRCAGAAVQRCDGASWTTVGGCLGSCSGAGACTGGSCATGFALSVPLPACAAGGDCVPPADGASTLLATAGPILDTSGTPVPDGTLVTASATGGAIVVAGDAAAATSGVQVRAHGGFADFAFRAPPASLIDPQTHSASVTVTAAVAGAPACASSANVVFGAGTSVAYVAEDFTTFAARDVAATTADWRTDLGAVELTRSEFGDGRDGALTLTAGQTWNLTSTTRTCPSSGGACPYAPIVKVTGLDAAAAAVEGALAGFSPGDEVLLLEAQGAGGSVAAAGTWELLTVASVAEGRLAFTSAIAGTYGASAGAALAGEKVLLQRVPHFTSVTVPAGATLTASAWDGTLGGVLALRASGSVTVFGAVHADSLGYRPGVSPDAIHGQAGESFGGLDSVRTAAATNLGGGSGGYQCGDPFHLSQLDLWYGGGGSYGTAGASTCAASTTYGSPNLARLFFGSGSGSQEQNTHGPCSAATCPAESKANYGFASKANGAACTTQACLDTFSFCPAETRNFGSALRPNDSGCTTQACLDTFASCGAHNVGFAAAALPCDGTNNPGCANTFATCPHTITHSNSPYPGNDCASACPRLVNFKADCGLCGCYKWGVFDCPISQCDPDPYCLYVCTGRDCGGDGTTGVTGACNSTNSCTQESDCARGDYCTSNCNIFGTNCDCHKECFQCWRQSDPAPGTNCNTGAPGGPFCNACNTCTGCQTNPGCATNPGCSANTGCNTCGGRIPGGQDGAACDYTAPGNTCRCPLPWQATAPGGRGGGILFLAAATLDVRAGGRVSAKGADPAGGGATPAFAGGAGGSLWLRVGDLRLTATSIFSAAGGVNGGAGRIRLERAGGADPVAAGVISPAPYVASFSLPTAQSRPMLPTALSARSVTSVGLVSAVEDPAGSWQVLAASDGTWRSIVPGGAEVGFGATGDVRWRVLPAAPTAGPSREYGVTWLLRLQ